MWKDLGGTLHQSGKLAGSSNVGYIREKVCSSPRVDHAPAIARPSIVVAFVVDDSMARTPRHTCKAPIADMSLEGVVTTIKTKASNRDKCQQNACRQTAALWLMEVGTAFSVVCRDVKSELRLRVLDQTLCVATADGANTHQSSV